MINVAVLSFHDECSGRTIFISGPVSTGQDAMQTTVLICRDIGIRFHPTRGAMSLGESKGGLPPDSCCEEEDAALKDMRRVIEEFHDNDRWSPCPQSAE